MKLVMQSAQHLMLGISVDRTMTLDEFLRWGDGTDTHHELIEGSAVPMARSLAAQRIVAARLGSQIEKVLSQRRPCDVQINAGVIPFNLRHTYFEADIAAICERQEFRQQALKEPFLIVEILSASTERHDRRVKLPAYRQIATVQESC